MPLHQQQPSANEQSVVYKLGIRGWRKRCLYFLILLIAIVAIVNLALIVWIIRVMDFGLHGMGKLHITSNGVRLDGIAEFVSALRATTITNRKNEPIQINSRKNLSLSAIDIKGNVVGQISLDSDEIILKSKKLHIQDQSGRTLLYADKNKMNFNLQNLHISVPGGLNLENSVQTTLVESTDQGEGLTLESLTKKLFINAAEGVDINSFGSAVKFTSYQDMHFITKNGKILLDSNRIHLKNIPQSTQSEDNNQVYGEISALCVCKDGTLFLSPPAANPLDQNPPCKVTNGICL